MRISRKLEEEMLASAIARPDVHIMLSDDAYTRDDGSIIVYRDGLSQTLHRRLYDLAHPDNPVPRNRFLVRICDEPKCVNPFPEHRRIETRPRQSIAVGSAAWLRRHQEFCLKAGHPLTDENVYRHTDKRGYVHRECRACKIAAAAQRRRNLKEQS